MIVESTSVDGFGINRNRLIDVGTRRTNHSYASNDWNVEEAWPVQEYSKRGSETNGCAYPSPNQYYCLRRNQAISTLCGMKDRNETRTIEGAGVKAWPESIQELVKKTTTPDLTGHIYLCWPRTQICRRLLLCNKWEFTFVSTFSRRISYPESEC